MRKDKYHSKTSLPPPLPPSPPSPRSFSDFRRATSTCSWAWNVFQSLEVMKRS